MAHSTPKRKFLPEQAAPPPLIPGLVDILEHPHNTRQKKKAKKHDGATTLFAENAEVPPESPLPAFGYWLKLQPQPPANPFVSVYFPVKVFLMERAPNKKEHMKIGHTVPVYVELLYENGDLVENQHILELHPNSDCQIRGSGVVELQFRLTELSMNHENKKFVLRFSCPHDRQLGAIEPVESHSMLVIRHRLSIMNHVPVVWYKDEGGRDKCIELNCLLTDEKDLPVLNRTVPLAVSLVYESEHQDVKNQKILKVNQGATPKIDMNGAVRLRLRIEEVSKNHQKQAFCIKVAPDTNFSPANCDIAPVVSTSVRVLSKRNKRRKSSFAAEEHVPSRNMINQASRSVHFGRNPGNRFSSNPVMRGHVPLPVQKIKKALPPSVSPASGSLPCVQGWCSFVYEGMKDLQWCHCGYEINDDGSVDMSRPLFRCPSCWVYKDMVKNASHRPDCMIHQSINSFRTIVQQKLTTIPTPPRVSLRYENTVSNLRKPRPESPSGSTTLAARSPKAGAFSARGSGGSSTLLSTVVSPALIKPDRDMPAPTTAESPLLQSKMPSIGEVSRHAAGNVRFSLLAPMLNRQISRDISGTGETPLPPPPPLMAATPLGMPPNDRMTSIGLSMPGMDRDISMPSLVWQTSQPMFMDSGAASPPGFMSGPPPLNTFSITSPPSTTEMEISSILGVLKVYGFPAYNKQDRCVGFYHYEEKDQNSQANLRFIKLSNSGLDANGDEMKSMNMEYLKYKHSQNDADRNILITKAECIELDRMKEKALLRHFELAAEKTNRDGGHQ